MCIHTIPQSIASFDRAAVLLLETMGDTCESTPTREPSVQLGQISPVMTVLLATCNSQLTVAIIDSTYLMCKTGNNVF